MHVLKRIPWCWKQWKRIAGTALIASAFLAACGVSIHNEGMIGWLSNAAASDAEILDISVTNCYAPYLSNPLLAKVVLVFDGDYPVPSPDEISSISLAGPGDLNYRLRNAPYDKRYFNGYLYDAANNVLWYQAYWNWFIPDGEYTLSINFVDGDSRAKSRFLRTNYELLAAYQTHQEELGFYPTNGVHVSGSSVLLRWTTLAEVGGPNAYYNSWLVGSRNGLMLSDSIFTRAESDSLVGLDRNWSWKSWPVLPAGNYRWFAEILDSNVFSEINMVIFQPWQDFTVY